MNTRAIKSVTIEFEDGSIERHDLPHANQGFFRERYTWEENGEGFNSNGVRCYEVMWSVRDPSIPLTERSLVF